MFPEVKLIRFFPEAWPAWDDHTEDICFHNSFTK